MSTDAKLNRIFNISRVTLAFMFLNHGLVPKIIWLDSTEIFLVGLHNFNIKAEYISWFGAVVEIFLGIVIIIYKKSLIPIYCSMILLAALLIDVSIMQPTLLTKAFNPMTMNVMGLSLCFIAVFSFPNNNDFQCQ